MDSSDAQSRPPGRDSDSKQEPHLDAVAHKPANQGGTPTTGPSADSHLDNLTPTPGAQPPEETKRASLREPHRVAAGMPALTQSLKFTLRETGFTRGIGTWLKVNKKDGF